MVPSFGRPEFAQWVAGEASVTTHVSKDGAPFLLIHGTSVIVVPFNQSELLHDALKMGGVE